MSDSDEDGYGFVRPSAEDVEVDGFDRCSECGAAPMEKLTIYDYHIADFCLNCGNLVQEEWTEDGL